MPFTFNKRNITTASELKAKFEEFITFYNEAAVARREQVGSGENQGAQNAISGCKSDYDALYNLYKSSYRSESSFTEGGSSSVIKRALAAKNAYQSACR